MHSELRTAYDAEMNVAIEDYYGNNLHEAFHHLEAAHVLGQSFTFAHVRAHWWMLRIGWKRRDSTEIRGQFGRILAALIFSRIWVPLGNTGGANVHPLKPMPIPEELQALLKRR